MNQTVRYWLGLCVVLAVACGFAILGGGGHGGGSFVVVAEHRDNEREEQAATAPPPPQRDDRLARDEPEAPKDAALAFRGGGSGPEVLADADAAAVPPRAPGDKDNLVGTSEGSAFPYVVFERISADAVSKMVRAGLAAIVDDSGDVGRVNGVPLQLRTRELQLRELSNVVLPSDLRPPERLHLTASGVANIQELASNSPATPSGGPLVVYFDEERICFSVRAIRQRN